jgi:hypothetical protein
LFGVLERRKVFGDLGIDWRVILKCIPNEYFTGLDSADSG